MVPKSKYSARGNPVKKIQARATKERHREHLYDASRISSHFYQHSLEKRCKHLRLSYQEPNQIVMGNCISGRQTVSVEPPLRTSSAHEVPRKKAWLVDKLNKNQKSETKTSMNLESQESIVLQSMSVSDDFKSTELDLSLSKEDSIAEASLHSNPSTCSAIYTRSNTSDYTRRSTLSSFKNSSSYGQQENSSDTLMPNSEYTTNDDTSSSQIQSSFDSSLQALPRVTESGNLDLESFKDIVMSKVGKLSAGKNDKAKFNKAVSLIRRLDKAVIKTMNKVHNYRSRSTAKVSPVHLAQDERKEKKALQNNEKKITTDIEYDIIVISDCEDD
jgi:hypothetical protein